MTEFIDIHVRKIHGGQVESSSPTLSAAENGGDEATTSSSLRGCPECGEEMRMAAIIKHCKVKHKVGIQNKRERTIVNEIVFP